MISFDQLRKAMNRVGINADLRQMNELLNDLLPNPQSGFSCDGATVWGDRQSIDKVRDWNHLASTIMSWRSQHDAQQGRAMRSEELGIRALDVVLRLSAENPAHVGSYRNLAVSFLEAHGIEPREGFFHDEAASKRDARSKFYAAAHPRSA